MKHAMIYSNYFVFKDDETIKIDKGHWIGWSVGSLMLSHLHPVWLPTSH